MLPNFLIIGAPKCGTTSLYRYLGEHPEIWMASKKELNFFSRPGPEWDDAIDWYRAHFSATAPLRGEASPSYTMHPAFPRVPERIHSLIPDAKLIYLVRDPIERLISHYVQHFALHLEHRSLADALADYRDPGNPYVSASRYAMQLERYLERFPPRQIMVVDQHQLLERRRSTLRAVLSFLGADPELSSPELERVWNPRESKVRLNRVGAWMRSHRLLRPSRRLSARLPGPMRRQLRRMVSREIEEPTLDPAMRASLASLFHDDADRLRAHAGQRFESWSV